MPLKAVVDKLDELDASLHQFYVEKNGKYELAVEITGIEGVKSFTDFSKLDGSLKKERNDHKDTKKKFEVFGDRKPEEVLAALDRIPELEAAAKGNLDENKLNEMVEGRIKSKLAPLERQVTTLSKERDELKGEVDGFKGKERTRTVHDNVRDAITKAQGFQPSAVEDALMFAERMLEVNEEGKVVTRDGVGVTPGVDATVWLSDMQQKKAHWWGPSGGGGAGGNRGGANGGSNPWTSESWNMTEQAKLYKENPTRAAQLAKAAGTSIGGQRPQPRNK